MKSSHPDPWQNLVNLARQAPPLSERSSTAPLGFFTRVVARVGQPVERSLFGLFESQAFRALSVASVLAIATVALNLSPVLQAFHDEAEMVDGESVTSGLLGL